MFELTQNEFDSLRSIINGWKQAEKDLPLLNRFVCFVLPGHDSEEQGSFHRGDSSEPVSPALRDRQGGE